MSRLTGRCPAALSQVRNNPICAPYPIDVAGLMTKQLGEYRDGRSQRSSRGATGVPGRERTERGSARSPGLL
jgi:hypothetical protein